MKNLIATLIITPLLFAGLTASAQKASPDVYRTATPKEILLHDNPYNILQREIEANICDANWGISKKPFLLSENPNEKVVIINYLKGVGNIPVFMREGESFEITMKPGSPFYRSNEDETKKQTAAYVARTANISSAGKKELAAVKTQNEQYFKSLDHLSNIKNYGGISLEMNQNNTTVYGIGKPANKQITAPGINYVSLFVQLPDESSADTVYNAILYLGNWPKLSNIKMFPFHFTKNNSSAPIIENMVIKISGFNYNKIMKIIHHIDWAKLDALIKK